MATPLHKILDWIIEQARYNNSGSIWLVASTDRTVLIVSNLTHKYLIKLYNISGTNTPAYFCPTSVTQKRSLENWDLLQSTDGPHLFLSEAGDEDDKGDEEAQNPDSHVWIWNDVHAVSGQPACSSSVVTRTLRCCWTQVRGFQYSLSCYHGSIS